MYQSLIEEVRQKMAKYSEKLSPPASPESLTRLENRTRIVLNTEVPGDYLSFLRLTDGLGWNGLVIYPSETGTNKPGSEDFVEANLTWRDYEPHREYLFFADGNISLYVYNIAEEKYQILDRPSEEVFGEFDTFEELITEAIRQHL